MSRDISNTADVIYSRDIIERLEELENDKGALEEAVDEAQEALAECDEDDDKEALEDAVMKAQDELEEWDDKDEYDTLKALCAEGEGYSDWSYGATLINESYFTEYAEELASDVCDMKSANSWPFNHIDWEAAAEDLKQDYSTIDYDGETFYTRD